MGLIYVYTLFAWNMILIKPFLWKLSAVGEYQTLSNQHQIFSEEDMLLPLNTIYDTLQRKHGIILSAKGIDD